MRLLRKGVLRTANAGSNSTALRRLLSGPIASTVISPGAAAACETRNSAAVMSMADVTGGCCWVFLRENGLFVSAFPYVCPEPVLVKRSFSY
jgi:hypothetical protein